MVVHACRRVYACVLMHTDSHTGYTESIAPTQNGLMHLNTVYSHNYICLYTECTHRLIHTQYKYTYTWIDLHRFPSGIDFVTPSSITQFQVSLVARNTW